MKSHDIVTTLFRFWVKGRVAIPNYKGSGSNGESDLFLVTGSGYCEEVEIKISLADFNREFKNKTFKHGCLNRHSDYDFTRTNPIYLWPRRFWFAVPAGLVEKIEPSLNGTIYGLLSVTANGITEIKEARVIKDARKLTYQEILALARCMTFRIARAHKSKAHT